MSKFKKNTIDLTQNDIEDAKASSSGLKNEAAKKRGFIDVLGARGAMNLFFENKFEVNNIYSMYSIQSVLNQIDIADIYRGEFKFDVRIVFDENEIFIPRAHFDYGILPDLYLVFKLEKDLSKLEFLGCLEPQNIDKQNTNSEFYFAEKSQLILPPVFSNYFKKLAPKQIEPSSKEEIERAEGLFSALVDNEISNEDKHFLIHQLSKNFTLRESFVEFENFEMISKNLVKETEFNNLEPKNEEPILEEIVEIQAPSQEQADVISLDEFDFNFGEEPEGLTIIEEITPAPEQTEKTAAIVADIDLLKDVPKAQSINEAPAQIEPLSKTNEDKDLLQALFKTEGLDKESMDFSQYALERLKHPENQKKLIIATIAISMVIVVLAAGITISNKNKASQQAAIESPLNMPPSDVTQEEMDLALQKQGQDPMQNPQSPDAMAAMQPADMGKSLSNALSNEGGTTSVSKIAWEVPEDLAYNDAFRKYLQNLGRNLKLTLENDLLLVTDIAYSPKMIIDLKISKNGTVEASNTVVSSGSKQIDAAVLRTVKEAAEYLKPPASEISSPSFNATLIINF